MAIEALAQRVEAVPGAPLPYGLFSVATPLLDEPEARELAGVSWSPLSCGVANIAEWCVEGAQQPKTWDRPGVAYAPPLVVYYGRDCPPIGETVTEAEAAARAGLVVGEQAAVEQGFAETHLGATAIDVTPVSGAVGLVNAVMILEQALALTYRGTGVIHAPTGAASGLGASGLLVADGARYRTWAGHLVALGAGYETAVMPGPDDGAGVEPADPGEAWLFATGPVAVRRGAVEVRTAVDTSVNDRVVLAERGFVVQAECVVLAVRTTLAPCCGGGGGDGPIVDGNFLELEN